MNMMFTLSRKKKNSNCHKNYWTLNIGHKHSIWEFLFLFNTKLLKVIGKHCSKKKISPVWGNLGLIHSGTVPFTDFKGKHNSD